MSLLESVIKVKVKTYAEARGWLVLTLDYSGWPDRLYVSPTGEHIYVEFKQRGKKPTRLQAHRHSQLEANGCRVEVIDNVDDGYRLTA